MINANSPIALRNTLTMWSGILVLVIVATWWTHTTLAKGTQETYATIEKTAKEIKIIEDEGVITERDWASLNDEEKKTERWNTMSRIAPTLSKLVGTDTPLVAKNVKMMKDISNKTGTGSYIQWLEKSLTSSQQLTLADTQRNIAEIIPIFAGLSDVSSTENIGGKITLKTLIQYIQTNIVSQFNLVSVEGSIGIQGVKFLDKGDIGVYEVPIKFSKVPNDQIMKLLEFLGNTGGIDLDETDTPENLTIKHRISVPLQNVLDNESKLKNLLIIIKDCSITPSRDEKKTDENPSISSNNRALWDVTLTLQFFIRGVSRDFILDLDSRIATLLDTTGKSGSLITRANALSLTCKNCPELAQIKDIIVLLTDARKAYDSFAVQEHKPNANATPIEILTHRTELTTTLETLENKLISLEQKVQTVKK